MPYSVPTGVLLDTHRLSTEEIINKSIENFLPMLDEFWEDQITTSQGMGKASEMGRDWAITKFFDGSYTGIIEGGNMTGQANLYGDVTNVLDTTTLDGKNSRVFVQDLTRTWPDPRPGANARRIGLRVHLQSFLTNLMFTLDELQAEANPGFIGQIVAPKFEGFARSIAHFMCNSFYVNQNRDYRLCKIGGATSPGGMGVPTGGTGTVRTVAFSPADGEVDRFYIGMQIDIMAGVVDGTEFLAGERRNDTVNAAANQSRGTRVPLIVVGVDELKNRVTAALSTLTWDTLQATGGPAAQTVAANDIVVHANMGLPAATPSTAFAGLASINSWLKTGGGGMDNILLGQDADSDSNYVVDVTVAGREQLKSMRKDAVGALTEHKLKQYLSRYHRAKRKYGMDIDCLIGSDGILTAYESQYLGSYWRDRTGRLASLNKEGQEEGFTFTHEGKTYHLYQSSYVEFGKIYGIKKKGGNWKRYVPPDPSGVRTGDGQLTKYAPFRWVLPGVTGGVMTKWPIRLGASVGNYSGMTHGWEMPGMFRMQLVPETPCGMILNGVNYDVTYSD